MANNPVNQDFFHFLPCNILPMMIQNINGDKMNFLRRVLKLTKIILGIIIIISTLILISFSIIN